MSRYLRRVVPRGAPGHVSKRADHPFDEGLVKTIEVYLTRGENHDLLFRNGEVVVSLRFRRQGTKEV